MKKKPYTAKTLGGAQRRVRELEKLNGNLARLLEQYALERKSLACLAVAGPTFFNPLNAIAAQNVRDRILRTMGMNPDGTFIQKGGER